MNEVINKDDIIESDNIKSLIYQIRGKQVMLDSDLAVLYGCSNGTKDVNKAVKRNIERFPDDFYFQLTDMEYQNLLMRFQFGTASDIKKRNLRHIPYVFTEQGVAMLSSVLRTQKASEVSINIMRTFIEMRKLIRYLVNYKKKKI